MFFRAAADGTRIARYRAPYTGIFQVQLVKGSTITWHLATATPPELAPLTGCDE